MSRGPLGPYFMVGANDFPTRGGTNLSKLSSRVRSSIGFAFVIDLRETRLFDV